MYPVMLNFLVGKTTCARCPGGENREVRTDVRTQTVFWLKILILLSLNKGTLFKCAHAEMVSDIGIWFRSVHFEAMTTSLTWQNGNAQMRQRDTSLKFW